MTSIYPKEGTQERRVLDVLLEAKGDWIKKSYIVYHMHFSQAA
jgi:hypothetical protein